MRCHQCGRLNLSVDDEPQNICEHCGYPFGSEPSEPSYLAIAAALDKTYQALDPRVEFPPAVDPGDVVEEAVKEGPC